MEAGNPAGPQGLLCLMVELSLIGRGTAFSAFSQLLVFHRQINTSPESELNDRPLLRSLVGQGWGGEKQA